MDSFYLAVLKEELVPALGCTEPIAVAYAAAEARKLLGAFPDEIIAECSGNVIKNVKGVIVPTTGNMRGIDTSAILGAVAGNPDRKLEVLSDVVPQDIERVKKLKDKNLCVVKLAEGVENLYIKIFMMKGSNTASVTISEKHTNIVEKTLNGKVLFRKAGSNHIDRKTVEKRNFSVRSIYEYITSVPIEDLWSVIDRQIEMNSKIAAEGITSAYGAEVGRTVLADCRDNIEVIAKAYAASGSDARMAGSILPVVINSGSGNQGIAVSLPVIKYAEYLEKDRELLYRALAFSNLIAIYIKSGIGKLSAFCGAVSAACGSGAAIAFLHGYELTVIKNTIINTLANTSGIVCDGAKASCAAKVASSVDAAIMAFKLAAKGKVFSPEEGLLTNDVDHTIENICRVAKIGMRETDIEILKIMTE